YEELLSKDVDTAAEDNVESQARLSLEYFIIRVALAWRQDRLDLAEHMFAKAAISTRKVDAATAESLADLLFEIGRELLSKTQFASAAKWLERSYDALMSQDQERLSLEAGELRLCISQSMVKSFVTIGGEVMIAKAQSLVSLLEQ
ncbi:MAG: hypothetical protein M4579_007542, partial [Chaenotheca gracillima]